MSEYHFCVAGPQENSLLHDLMENTVMDGNIQIIYQRKPDFFQSFHCTGEDSVVLCVIEKKTGLAVACGSVNLFRCYIQGKSHKIGYLSNLRIRKEHRKGILLARIFKFLKNLSLGISYFITTVIDDNSIAQSTLESKKGNLPCYELLGKYHTYSLILSPYSWIQKFFLPSDKKSIIKNSLSQDKEIHEFIKKQGIDFAFFPEFLLQRLFSVHQMPGLSKSSYFTCNSPEGEILATAGYWDQSSFKQYVIKEYKGIYKSLAPFSRLISRLTGFYPLPQPGEKINCCYLFMPLYKKLEFLRPLISHIYQQTSSKGFHQLITGCFENSPLNEIYSAYPHIFYPSKLYLVYWDENKDSLPSIEDLFNPYLEVSLL